MSEPDEAFAEALRNETRVRGAHGRADLRLESYLIDDDAALKDSAKEHLGAIRAAKSDERDAHNSTRLATLVHHQGLCEHTDRPLGRCLGLHVQRTEA